MSNFNTIITIYPLLPNVYLDEDKYKDLYSDSLYAVITRYGTKSTIKDLLKSKLDTVINTVDYVCVNSINDELKHITDTMHDTHYLLIYPDESTFDTYIKICDINDNLDELKNIYNLLIHRCDNFECINKIKIKNLNEINFIIKHMVKLIKREI